MVELNPIKIAKVSNELSKGKYSELMSLEEEKGIWLQVINSELEAGADRSIDAIGQAGNLVSYEFMSLGVEEMVETALQARFVMEMIFALKKPTNTLFAISATSFPLNYIESLNTENLYVPNDENLYRGETYFVNGETRANVLDYSDVFSGIFPSDLDCICFSGTDLFAASNQDLVSQAFSALNDNGILVVWDTSDGMSLYKQKVSTPGYQVHKKLLEIEGASVYHLPLNISFTILTKNA
jgi:hypothetical protein